MSELSYDHVVPRFLLRGFCPQPNLTWLFERGIRPAKTLSGLRSFGGETGYYDVAGVIKGDPILKNAENECYKKLVQQFRTQAEEQVKSTQALRLVQHFLHRSYGFRDALLAKSAEHNTGLNNAMQAQHSVIREAIMHFAVAEAPTKLEEIGESIKTMDFTLALPFFQQVQRMVQTQLLHFIDQGILPRWQMDWSWRIKAWPDANLILGSTVLLPWNSLGEITTFDDPNTCAISLTLSDSRVLWGGKLLTVQPKDLSRENARCSRLWFVAKHKTQELVNLHASLGTGMDPWELKYTPVPDVVSYARNWATKFAELIKTPGALQALKADLDSYPGGTDEDLLAWMLPQVAKQYTVLATQK